MGLLDAYQDSTDKVVEVMLSRPVEPEPVKPKHSVWSTIPRALGAAGAEVVGNVSDVLDAFGQTAAAAGGMGAGIRPNDEKRGEQSAEAFRKLKIEGIDWRSDDSRQAYTFARDLRPDPATAGTAENIVFGLTKGLAKAVSSAMMMGPIPGALGFGLSEGMTASEDLAEQGVDPATRFKVGAVTAAMNTAGVALPVAGKSMASTAALVVAGGPGSFVAQQMATRSILENADYGALAAQYDPLDPVGLIVSTLVPAGFAAYAKRGEFSSRPAVDAGGQPAPDAAPDVAQAAPKMALTQDDIDAVMVQNLTAGRDAHEAEPVAKFAAEMSRGPVTENPNFKAWFGNSKTVDENGSPRVFYHGSASNIESFNPDLLGRNTGAASAEMAFFFTSNPVVASGYSRTAPSANQILQESLQRQWEATDDWDVKANITEQISEAIRQQELDIKAYGQTGFMGGANISPVYVSVKNPMLVNMDGMTSYADKRFSEIIKTAKENGHDGVIFKDAQDSGSVFDEAISDVVAVFEPTQIKSAVGNSGRFDPNSASLTDPVPLDAPSKPATTEAAEVDAFRARVDDLMANQPDMVARIDENGEPVRLADELAAIRKAAEEGTDTELGTLDAPLLKVAAECALSIGTAAI